MGLLFAALLAAAPAAQADIEWPGPGHRRLGPYLLRVQAEKDVRGDTILVSVELRRPGSARNLLEPRGPSHGMLPSSFLARDLAAGPAKSLFGNPRTIAVAASRERVEIALIDQALAPTGTESLWKWRRLKLRLRLFRG